MPTTLTTASRSTYSSSSKQHQQQQLPPLFYYMEIGDWEKATDRIRRHPREVKTWATIRTASTTTNKEEQRLALHHACFKLRSAGSWPTDDPTNDPFVRVCRFLLVLIRLYPEAAGQRESRHGCLPLHLAAFASCAPRSGRDARTTSTTSSTISIPIPVQRSKSTDASSSSICSSTSGGTAIPAIPHASSFTSNNTSTSTTKPNFIARRVASDATTETNMTAMHAEETYQGTLGDDRVCAMDPNVRVAAAHNCAASDPRREEFAVAVINALLDAYPKAIRVDSEGGRLVLHTACAGRATPRVISTLLTAYPAACRHRNKDGFLPLHLAAHWGVSHASVAVLLLKSYPDATLGRNRWERTPLEEALCMAGENGRPHQAALVRALRRHPSYWTRPVSEFDLIEQIRSGPIDMDQSLPSNDSTDDNRGKAFGQAIMLDVVEVEAKFLANSQNLEQAPSAPATSPSGILRLLHPKWRAANESDDNLLHLEISLVRLVQELKWKTVIARVVSNPLEAETDLQVITRGGFAASNGMTLLHYVCEREPPVAVVHALIEAFPLATALRCMPGGALPLHVACTWYASADVVTALLSTDLGTSQMPDELGNLALHSACFSGASEDVIAALLEANGKAALARNNQGSRPIDIVRRLRHENRRSVMTLLLGRNEVDIHGRNPSLGSISEVAAATKPHHEEQRSESDYRAADDLHEHPWGVEVADDEVAEDNEDLVWI